MGKNLGAVNLPGVDRPLSCHFVSELTLVQTVTMQPATLTCGSGIAGTSLSSVIFTCFDVCVQEAWDEEKDPEAFRLGGKLPVATADVPAEAGSAAGQSQSQI